MASTIDSLRELRSFDLDFHGWLTDQVSLIKAGRLDQVDWRNVIEELMAAARSEERALESDFEILLIHLLKWRYQREQRDQHLGNWQASIITGRAKIERLIIRSPSLKSQLNETFRDAHFDARARAGAEMGWRREKWERELPATCPWTLERVLSDFWPDD